MNHGYQDARHLFFSFAATKCTGLAAFILHNSRIRQVFAGMCMLMRIHARDPVHKAVVGDRRTAGSAMLKTRIRSASVSNATSGGEIDRYQAKDTIWKISVPVMTIVCQGNGRGESKRIEYDLVDGLAVARQPALHIRGSYSKGKSYSASSAGVNSVTVYIQRMRSCVISHLESLHTLLMSKHSHDLRAARPRSAEA